MQNACREARDGGDKPRIGLRHDSEDLTSSESLQTAPFVQSRIEAILNIEEH